MPKRIVLDSTLVAPWSLQLSKEEPFEYPFQAQYQFENTNLRFIESKNIFFKFKKLPQFFDFERWYLNKNGRPFLASEITLDVTEPLEKGELFTQRISSALCKIRDQFIINSINDALNKYNSILVIYGGSHWSTQKRSFQEALGKPQFFNFSGS